ncbi:hypothetical protein CVT24_009841 [Panaeolus cyanescens]|uniref:Uncharacterized protein n=1 Tax=Panaeolus cyanescens TaxID=181874 RepID=A0A409VY53_9AGAR|nr:hypothetical protein CVT24_009841 [Panaeolus cyanescens]
MGTNVDDRHGSVAYRGRWSSSGGDPKYYGSTISATNNNGATATFKFRGTQVKLYLVVPIGNSGTVRIRSQLDDRAPSERERNAHPNTVYNDMWFDAANLPNTEHTLVITNIGTEGGNAMQIDRFEIDGSPVSAAAPPPPPPPPSPQTTPTPTPTQAPPQTTAQISSHVVTSVVTQINTVVTTNSLEPTPGISSSDPVSSPNTSGSISSLSGSSTVSSANSASGAPTSPSQPNASDKTVTAIQILTTAPNGSVQTIMVTPDQQGSQGDTSNEAPLGAIIGGVVGALVLLVIASILAFLLIRRRRKRVARGDDSEHLTRQTLGAISPFALVEDQGDPSPKSTAIWRQPSLGTTGTSNSESRSHSGYHGFNADEKRDNSFGNASAYSPENQSIDDVHRAEFGGSAGLPLIMIEPRGSNHIFSPQLGTFPADSPSTISQASPLGTLPNAHLDIQDNHDVPPSYQSVGHRTSGVRRSLLNSPYLSYTSPTSPRYSHHGFGGPAAADPRAL